MKSRFGFIKEVDNWGRLSYAVGPHNRIEDCVVRVKGKGDTVTVKWKNGSVTEHRLVYEGFLHEVSEQGHMPTTVYNRVPHIELEVCGCVVRARMTAIKGLKVLLPS
jgi:hypothetical protein